MWLGSEYGMIIIDKIYCGSYLSWCNCSHTQHPGSKDQAVDSLENQEDVTDTLEEQEKD